MMLTSTCSIPSWWVHKGKSPMLMSSSVAPLLRFSEMSIVCGYVRHCIPFHTVVNLLHVNDSIHKPRVLIDKLLPSFTLSSQTPA